MLQNGVVEVLFTSDNKHGLDRGALPGGERSRALTQCSILLSLLHAQSVSRLLSKFKDKNTFGSKHVTDS